MLSLAWLYRLKRRRHLAEHLRDEVVRSRAGAESAGEGVTLPVCFLGGRKAGGRRSRSRTPRYRAHSGLKITGYHFLTLAEKAETIWHNVERR